MRFRNNRIPYMFPAWVGDKFCHMTVTTQTELWGDVEQDLDDRLVIKLAFDCASDEDAPIRIEWMKECMEVIEP